MRFRIAVDVMPKGEVADPQGTTIERALPTLGIEGISDVRVGKRMVFWVEAENEARASQIVDEACRRFLSNPVIEDYEFSTSAPIGGRGDGGGIPKQ